MTINRRHLLGASAAAVGSMGISRLYGNTYNENVNSSVNEGDLEEVTENSRKAIKKGTAWLLKAINKDGGAGLDIGTTSDVCCTGVVGVALLSQGNTPMEGEHRRRQKKITEYLLRRTEQMGSTGSMQNTRSQIEGDLGPFATHFFSTICLSQMIGESPNVDRCRRALQRLERYISSNQRGDGSWGTDAWAPMLATACGWISLRAANFAGISVAGSSVRAGEYLIRNMPQIGRKWGSGSWYHRLYGTAAGLRVLYAMAREADPKAQKALQDILALVETNNRAFGGAGGEEYLTFHFMTEMLMQQGGDDWVRWYPVVRDKLVRVQNNDGSWTGHHCITSRTFSTACALMTLTAPNRFLPISQV